MNSPVKDISAVRAYGPCVSDKSKKYRWTKKCSIKDVTAFAAINAAKSG
jgi:hypothetical protein